MPTKSPTSTGSAASPYTDGEDAEVDEDAELDDESLSSLIRALHPPTTRSAASMKPQPTRAFFLSAAAG
ncbi:hypothetical protein [Streptomyces sp. NPDC091209]|uniref:hypothetical protein n=1 Tax=Streptomyces sp. NPDC091209 TaxID=3365974 RepID=UPI0037F9BFAB